MTAALGPVVLSRAARIGAYLCCAALIGCAVGKADFPASWAPVETGQKDCLALNGVYENFGSHVTYQNQSEIGYLSSLLFKDAKLAELKGGDRTVRISMADDGALEFTLSSSGQPILVKKYRAHSGDYRCEHETIEISVSGPEAAGGGLFVQSGTAYISRSADGALVVKVSAVGAGVGLIPFIIPIMPVGGAVTEWYRFEQHRTSTKAGSQ
jgi:hypothetical protein